MRNFSSSFRATLVALSLSAGIASAGHAATLHVVGGILVGASNVDVSGGLYNVAFVDGTCIALFSGCDSSSDFAFTSLVSATDAAQALLDQVFLDDDGSEQFDSEPFLIAGCEGALQNGEGFCLVETPFALSGGEVRTATSWNDAFEGFDFPDEFAYLPSDDLTSLGDSVYAVWTPVPEPGTASLLALGLIALGARRRG